MLVIALFVGLLAELPLMAYFVRRCGLRYSLTFRIKSPAIKSALVDAIPLGLGTIAAYLSGALLQRTASYGGTGAVACFNYSLVLCGSLIILICRPAQAALAPRITRALEYGDYRTSTDLLGKSLAIVVLVCLAGMSVVWAESRLIVDVIFGRGQFSSEAVAQTGHFLGFMFLAVLGLGVRMLAVVVLLARRRAKTIMVYCMVSAAVRAGLAVGGRAWWGADACVFAYVGGAWVDGLLSIMSAGWIARLKLRNSSVVAVARWAVACAIVGIIPLIPRQLHPLDLTSPVTARLFHLGGVVLVAGACLLLACSLVGINPLGRFIGSVAARIGKSRGAEQENQRE